MKDIFFRVSCLTRSRNSFSLPGSLSSVSQKSKIEQEKKREQQISRAKKRRERTVKRKAKKDTTQESISTTKIQK